MAENQGLVILYTAKESPYNPTLDSAILWDTWLLPPPSPVAEIPVQEIELDEFNALWPRLNQDEVRKFKMILAYDRFFGTSHHFNHPKNYGIKISLLPKSFANNAPPAMQTRQKVILCLTCEGPSWVKIVVDSCEPLALELPAIPSGYEEIDLADFEFEFKKGLEPGRKFGSQARFYMTSGTQARFYSDDGGSNVFSGFNLTKRPPKLEENQPVTILYTVTTDKFYPDLDDIII
jgi:hypothetical protein